MTGLPRANDVTSPRSAFGLVVVESIERLTTSLRRGDPFSQGALDDLVTLCRRLEGFSAALRARLKAAEMEDVINDE